jgi:hypothetical protein
MLNSLRNTVTLVERLAGAFESRGVAAERAFGRIVSDDGLLARFADVLAEDAKDQAGLTAYATRFTAAIAAGKYDYVSDYLTPEQFPESVFGTVGEGHVLAQPPATDKGYWTEKDVNDWLAEQVKQGFEPATLADGLAFGVQNPDAQRENPVVCWGSLSRSRHVACLGRHGVERDVHMYSRDVGWGSNYRFLLRKVLPKP